MFLRSTNRRKDGKDHRYFSIVENRRLPGGKTAQRTVLYLGEINDQQPQHFSQLTVSRPSGSRCCQNASRPNCCQSSHASQQLPNMRGRFSSSPLSRT